MKYCLPIMKMKKYIADEIIIPYTEVVNNDEFETFIKKHMNRRIIIDMSMTVNLRTNFSLLAALCGNYNNVCCMVWDGANILDPYLEKNIPFFFSNEVSSWEHLYALLKYHPTDMRVGGRFCFNIEKIAKMLHSNNITVRVCPWQAFETQLPQQEKAFFIRPEDIKYYEGLIDVMDLALEYRSTFTSVIEMRYKAYAIDKRWAGRLNELICGLPDDCYLDGRYLDDHFGKKRVDCGGKCYWNDCNMCSLMNDMCKTLEEKGVRVKRRTKKKGKLK